MSEEALLYFRRSGPLPHVEMRRADRSCACYQTHTHDEFSVGVVDAGRATHRNRNGPKTIRQGTTVLINPGEAHSCNPDAGQRWSYRMLFIEAGWMGRLQADLPGVSGGAAAFFALDGHDAPAVYRQFDSVFNALAQGENPLAADEKLIGFLMRHALAHADAPRGGGEPEGQLKRARELIMDQLSHNVTLTAMAHASGLSPYQLIRRFRQAYGQTPHAFQLDQRINRGKQLLKRGDSLVEVALQLGFADQSHFQRHFKQRHAVTPKVYLGLNPAQSSPSRVARAAI
ncbi:AraC family transcriptional regulator [soil metagenome]